MPSEIVPLHRQEYFKGDPTPDDNYISMQGSLSSLQNLLLGPEPVREAAKKFDDATLDTLERIAECEDDYITVANQLLAQKSASVDQSESSYRVPKNIDDNTLLGLKAQGLVMGQGRVVSLTKAGKVALRDRWLKQPNRLKESRVRDRFDLENAQKKLITSEFASNGKFKKLAGHDQSCMDGAICPACHVTINDSDHCCPKCHSKIMNRG